MAKKNITDELRNSFVADLMEFLNSKYDTDVCQINSGSLMIPTVDSEGEDRWAKFSVIIPKDVSEENGNDGYALAKEYQLKLDAAAARKAENERKSAEKAAKAAARAKNRSKTPIFFIQKYIFIYIFPHLLYHKFPKMSSFIYF